MNERIYAVQNILVEHVRPAYSYVNCETFVLDLTAPCKNKKFQLKEFNVILFFMTESYKYNLFYAGIVKFTILSFS
jgi:hypothetical protein